MSNKTKIVCGFSFLSAQAEQGNAPDVLSQEVAVTGGPRKGSGRGGPGGRIQEKWSR